MTTSASVVSPTSALQLDDPVAAAGSIAETMRRQVVTTLGRRGLVLGMSGGVDSSVCAALAVRAVGADRVLGVFMPERDSDPISLQLARDWAERLGVPHVVEDISGALEGCGCYQRRDDAIRRLVPEFGEGWRCKLVLPGGRLDSDRLNVFRLAVQPPNGELRSIRLPPVEYRAIVAATNFKQRIRKMIEYYHADRLHYAVLGTPNRLEYDQGFFVKGGDGLADVKPIAHLYKSQVYQLADCLGVPAAITSRPPTTDTYSLPQSQEEFYFALPARTMDLALFAHNAGLPPEQVTAEIGCRVDQLERAYREIEQKRSTTRYLHAPPLLIEPVAEVRHPSAGTG